MWHARGVFDFLTFVLFAFWKCTHDLLVWNNHAEGRYQFQGLKFRRLGLFQRMRLVGLLPGLTNPPPPKRSFRPCSLPSSHGLSSSQTVTAESVQSNSPPLFILQWRQVRVERTEHLKFRLQP